MISIVEARKYDYVFIHRELFPFGPPIGEWIIARLLKKRIVYDFDDAIWLTDRKHESFIERLMRYRRKVGLISQWSHVVTCGNEYLCAYARQYNPSVKLNPTTIDTAFLHNRELYSKRTNNTSEDPVIIGWTGSSSTLKYLKSIEPVLKELEKTYPFKLLIIADKPLSLDLKLVEFRQWTRATEIEDLLEADIGIMPLPDDPWTRGKCGFKALQYMALEIPAVVSGVGVNTTIIENGVDGFCCSSEEEWIKYLSLLINNAELRKNIAKNGRAKVVNYFSLNSNSSNFLSLFE